MKLNCHLNYQFPERSGMCEPNSCERHVLALLITKSRMERKWIRRKRFASCASVRTRSIQVITFALVQRTFFPFGEETFLLSPQIHLEYLVEDLGFWQNTWTLSIELLMCSMQSTCNSLLRQAYCHLEFVRLYCSWWHIVSIPPSKIRGRNKWLPVG